MEHSSKKKIGKSVLVVVAHPDDEAIGCAGTILKHTLNGDKVQILILSDGFSSRLNGEKRDNTAYEVSSELGCKKPILCNFPDNKLDSIPLIDLVKRIEQVISEFSPEIIYTHHVGDLNIDHQITHKAVMTACRPLPNSNVKQIYAFEILSSSEWQTPGYFPFIPNVYVDISNYIETKKQILIMYGEEMRDFPHSRSIENIINLASLRGASVGINYAEAFMLLRKVC